jgi:hypothetical protein
VYRHWSYLQTPLAVIRLNFGFSLLIGLTALAPVFAVADGLVAQQFIALSASVALIVVAATSRTVDLKQAAEITRWVRFIALIPAIWLIVQIVPLPNSLTHSIWASASAALHEELFGHISVDPGKTINALVQYLVGCVLVAICILVLRERRRAELMLFVLCGSSTSMTFGLALTRSGYLGAIEQASSSLDINETLVAVSMIGLLVNLAAAVRIVERYDGKHGQTKKTYRSAGLKFLICMAAAISCLLALASVASLNIGIVAAFGVTTFVSIQLIRRIEFSPWLTGVFCATTVVAAAMIVAWRYDGARPVSMALQFAPATSADIIGAVQRMISDASWTGNGGGTYAGLLPVYREAGLSIAKAPTTAAAIAIEWGGPALVIAVAMTIELTVVLLLGALARGRDSFFSAAATACAVMLLGEAFCDATLLQSAVALIGEIVIGLGLAQSVGRIGAS